MKKVFAQIISEWLEDFISEDILQRDIDVPAVEQLHEILAITGPRRAGKTFLMYQMITNLIAATKCKREDFLYIDFEDYRLSGVAGPDLDDLFAAFVQLSGQQPKYLFFDEIQHLADWGRILRTFHNKRKYKIVVSGSNSELLSKEIATELRGRYVELLITPYSFKEYLKQNKIDYNRHTQYLPERGNIIRAFDQYLFNGSFPEVTLKENEKERRKLLHNYYYTVFYNDIIDRYNIKAKDTLNGLMSQAVNGYSELFSISSFEKSLKQAEIPTSKRTISNYLQYLKNAYFLILIEKFSYSTRKRMMNPVKLYLIDTGFSALGINFSENRGKLLENIVAIELFRRGEKVFYYKEKRECDFLIIRNTKPEIAIQVCWELNQQNIKRELEALIEIKENLSTKENFVLTYDQDDEIEYRSQKFILIPVWKWLLFFE